MNEWIAPAAGVLGALAGGIAVGFSARVLEEARWRREDRVRWLATRREAYGSFLNATRRVYQHGRAVMMLTDVDDLAEETKSPERRQMNEERWSKLFEAQEETKVALADIEILASEPVRRAALRLEEAVDASVRGTLDFKLALREGGKNEAQDILGKVIRAEMDSREDFRVAVRVELGLADRIAVPARPIGMATPYVPRTLLVGAPIGASGINGAWRVRTVPRCPSCGCRAAGPALRMPGPTLVSLARTQRGPGVVPLREGTGQGGD